MTSTITPMPLAPLSRERRTEAAPHPFLASLAPLPLPRADRLIFMRLYYLAPNNISHAFSQLLQQHRVDPEDASCRLSPNAPYCRTDEGVQPRSTCTISIHVSDNVDDATRQLLKTGLQEAIQLWAIMDPEHPAFIGNLERYEFD